MRSRTTALCAAAAIVAASVAYVAVDPAGAATGRSSMRVCGAPAAKSASCQAKVVTANGVPLASTSPGGLNPADIQDAYKLTGSSSTSTVAVVDAYDDPTAEADLGVYRAQFGLAPCTTSNGCFRKVNQTGGSTLPRKDAGWAAEISLDLDMVSATCPSCKILLVEASSNSFANLGTAVNYAVGQPGVAAISNSYSGSDSAQNNNYDHPGIAITASTGDSGYGVGSPASFDSVVAVGGTSLNRAAGTTRGWTETAWSGAGSGCSSLNAKPSWQTTATQCSGKALADVSAVADPQTGVSVYDTTRYQGSSGWLVFGGTSASAPIIGAVYALGGNLAGYPASYTWGHASGLFDVTSGSNGNCPTAVWCHAGVGWDGPTGLGTPNGTAAF